MDAQTESRILETLRTWTDGSTVIMVTHRLEAARKADRIVVLDRGRMVDNGTHRELEEQMADAAVADQGVADGS